MCNLADFNLPLELPLRIRKEPRVSENPRAARLRAAASGRRVFAPGGDFVCRAALCLALFAALPVAGFASSAAQDGAVQTSSAASAGASPATGAGDASSLGTTPAEATAVNFGHVPLGAAAGAVRTVPISLGSSAVVASIQALTLGVEVLDFTVAGSTCLGASDKTCTVNVQFLPTVPGLRRGALVLYGNTNPQIPLVSVPLYGMADSPIAALAPHAGTVVSTGVAAPVTALQMALDGAGNLYAGNHDDHTVLKLPSGGGAASVIGTAGISLEDVSGVALDGAGNLFIADRLANQVGVVTPAGTASVLNISSLSPALSGPTALAFDAPGDLYIADSQNSRIVRVESLAVGTASTGAGSVVPTGEYTLGSGGPAGVAVDAAGTLYIADPANNRIVKVTVAGAASLVSTPGFALNAPQSVSVDGMGNVYIADSGNNRVVELTTTGTASVVGTPGLEPFSPLATLSDPMGSLLIADGDHHRLVAVPVSSAALDFPVTKVGLASSPQTATITNLGNLPLLFTADPTYTADFSRSADDGNPCTRATSLASGAGCDVGVELTPRIKGSLSGQITVANNSLNVARNLQQITVTGESSSPDDTTQTVVSASPSPLIYGQAVTLTATVTDTSAGDTSQVPIGSVTFTDSVGTTLTSLNSGVGVTLNSAGVATLSGVLLQGTGVHTLTAIYGGETNAYQTSTGTTQVTLNQAAVTLTIASPTVAFGQTGSIGVTVSGPYTTLHPPSGNLTYSILNAAGASVASGTVSLTQGVLSSTATVPVPNTLPPANYTVSVSYGGDNNYLATPTATVVGLMVGKAAPAVSLASSLNPVLVSNPVTLTATVSTSLSTTPTGSFSFYNGSTFLATVTLGQGATTAALATSSLPLGIQSLTAIYSGDSNFASVTSPVLLQTVEDFTLAVVTTTGQSAIPTALPGGSLSFTVQVDPTRGTDFPSAVALSASGLPGGAVATFTPSGFAAGAPGTNVTFTIQFPQQILSYHPRFPLGGGPTLAMLGGLLLLPFALSLRKWGGGMGRVVCTMLLLLAIAGGALGLASCGATRSGYFGQQVVDYTVTITGTSGALTHTTTVYFQVD